MAVLMQIAEIGFQGRIANGALNTTRDGEVRTRDRLELESGDENRPEDDLRQLGELGRFSMRKAW
eukprot:89635-Rhodomonas_salina.4